MLVLFAFVSSNASSETFVNETMTSNNATLWASIDSGILFNANFATSQYGLKFPVADDKSMTSVTVNTGSERLIYGKQIELDFAFMYNMTCNAGPMLIFEGGLGVTTGYPRWYISVSGYDGATLNLYEGSTSAYSTEISKDTLYRVKMRNIGSVSTLYIDDVLVYTNTASALNIYDTDNKLYFSKQNFGTSVCKLNAFFNNLTLTQKDTGMLMNFTVRDENSYEAINKTLMKFLLYKTTDPTIMIDYKESNSSMIQFFNLSAVEYFVIYHDSVYDSRTYKWTQNKNWDNVTLYTLNNSGGVPVSITVMDGLHNQNLANANVLIQRSINFTQQTVYDGFTDGTGIATTLLNTTNVYTITASYTGFENKTTIITNLPAPYTIQIKLGTSSQGNTSIATNYFSGAYTPKNMVSLYNTTPILFTLNTFSIYFMIEYQGLTATVGGVKYDNYSLSPSGGSLTLPILATQNKFNVTYYIKIRGFDNYTMNVPYNVFTPSNASIVGTADDIGPSFSIEEKFIIVIMTMVIVIVTFLFIFSLVGVDPAWSFYGGVGICLVVFTAINWIVVWVSAFIGIVVFLILFGRNYNG